MGTFAEQNKSKIGQIFSCKKCMLLFFAATPCRRLVLYNGCCKAYCVVDYMVKCRHRIYGHDTAAILCAKICVILIKFNPLIY